MANTQNPIHTKLLKLFESFTQAFPAEQLESPPKGLIPFCRYYSKGMGWPLLFMSLTMASLAILEVSLFGFLGQLVDWLAEQDKNQLFQQQGLKLLGMSVILLVVLPLLVISHSMLVHQSLLGNYPMSIRWLAHRYLLRQSIAFYQDDFAGRIATKVMQTALSVRETVMKLLDVMVYVSVYFISILFLIAAADLRLMLPLVVWLICYVAIQIYFVPKLKRVSTEQADARSTMTGRIVDSYTNINTIKLFSHSEAEAQYAQEGMQTFLTTVYQQMRLVTGINVSIQIMNYLLVFSMTAISLWLWQASAVSIGSIAIAISLALRLNGMSQWVMWEVSSLFENIGTVIDGANTLSRTQTVMDKPDAPPLAVNHGKVEFNQVSFSYEKDSKVFHALDLTIQAGEKVGIVGRSGAGKSTLVNLLLRFYDIQSGQISIDEQNISEIKQDSLRANIGMVTQDTSLLHRSIRENILYGQPNATEEQMIMAAKKAEAHEFILELTDMKGKTGYDAQVGERGVKLSGGQRQRIAIARVLLKDAPILILDEATSALDSEVEAAIQTSLYQLMSGKTVIAIAHRLSTIAAMDRLIVIDEGRIIEEGNHQTLIKQGGIYAQLWDHQTGGFLGRD